MSPRVAPNGFIPATLLRVRAERSLAAPGLALCRAEGALRSAGRRPRSEGTGSRPRVAPSSPESSGLISPVSPGTEERMPLLLGTPPALWCPARPLGKNKLSRLRIKAKVRGRTSQKGAPTAVGAASRAHPAQPRPQGRQEGRGAFRSPGWACGRCGRLAADSESDRRRLPICGPGRQCQP